MTYVIRFVLFLILLPFVMLIGGTMNRSEFINRER